MTGSMSGNNFSFIIDSPSRANRYFSMIALNNDAACGYPGGDSFVKGFNDVECADVFSGTLSIDDAIRTCGWQSNLDDTTATVTGTIDVVAMDYVGTFNGIPITRATHASVRVELTIPVAVNVTASSLEVYSPVNTLAAITEQQYDSVHDLGTFLLTTSVQWPFVLMTPSTPISSNINFGTSISLYDASGCNQDAPDTPCTQVWQVNITNIQSSGACLLDGNYTTDWGYNCSSGLAAGSCPANGTQTIPSITAQLHSDNLCGQVNVVASLSAEMEAYPDSFFTTATLIYYSNFTMYFQVTVTAAVTVSFVSVVDVFVNVAGYPTVPIALNYNGVEDSYLYSGFSPTNNVGGFEFVAVAGSPADGAVVFDTDSGLGLFTFTVQANLIVTYQTTFGRKRSTVSEKLAVSKQLLFNARDNTPASVDQNAPILEAVTDAVAVTAAAAAASGVVYPHLTAIGIALTATAIAVLGL